MSTSPLSARGWLVWRILTRSQLREQPLRMLAMIAAIALGVALGSAVYLINTSALSEFDLATRRLVGNADLIVRGPPQGFDEQLFVRLAQTPAVAIASPVLELELTIPGDTSALKVLGVDTFRASALQPLLMGELAGDSTLLLRPDSIVLTRAAAQELHLQRDGILSALVGGERRSLRVIDVLTDDVYPEPLGLMDIATAQLSLGSLGKLNRIDLRMRAGTDVEAFRAQLAQSLPAGIVVRTPAIERGRAVSATRAYRVNLNMLALVALLTGAFLVFSTQSLSVLRRRTSLGLLRALGVTRGELRRALLGEGAFIGVVGSVPGALLGALLASLVLRYLGSGLGNRQLITVGATLALQPWAIIGFIILGTVAACLGAYLPAREAARRPAALALRAGDAELAMAELSSTWPGVLLIMLGAAVAWLPPTGGIAVPGYAAIALLLVGSVLLIPLLMRTFTRLVPRTGRVVIDTALAQLEGSAAVSTVSVACIIVSFSLMVAMAVMVHSFRDSFDLWLIKLLPADLQLRVSLGSDTGSFTWEQQRQIARLPGVAKARFRRTQSLYLRADRAPVSLIARERDSDGLPENLPLIKQDPSATRPDLSHAVWISEAVVDKFGLRVGDSIQLPLQGHRQTFIVAGVWRDYARPDGALVIDRDVYIAATGDRDANDGSVWREPGTEPAALERALRASLQLGDALEVIGSTQLRDRALNLFDRAFAITYALEVIAVAIGLAGVAVAASSTALARRAEFGMLRHIGMLRRQVLAMLASEGVITSTISVVYGLGLGLALSVVLVYVVNRQSFNWSIDLSVPWWQLALLSSALVLASALTALWSGRAAMSQEAIRAVREDW